MRPDGYSGILPTDTTHTINFNGGTLRLRSDVPDLFANLSAGSVLLGAGGGIFDIQSYDVSVASDIIGTGPHWA